MSFYQGVGVTSNNPVVMSFYHVHTAGCWTLRNCLDTVLHNPSAVKLVQGASRWKVVAGGSHSTRALPQQFHLFCCG